jgi:hypothetical protein
MRSIILLVSLLVILESAAFQVVTTYRRFGGRPSLTRQGQSATAASTTQHPFSDVNGESIPILDNVNITDTVPPDSLMPMAPPLTFDKYLTMLEKRVVVTIQYSAESGLKPYYLTVAKKIKAIHPDVLIEKLILPPFSGEDGEATFEVLVDGKLVVGKNNANIQKLGSDKGYQDLTNGLSIFISMAEVDLAITKARRRRRPSTMYGRDTKKQYGANAPWRGDNETSNREEADDRWND